METKQRAKMKRVILVLIALLLACLVPADTTSADPGWNWYKDVVCSGTDATGIQGTHSNFPVLISLTDNRLKYAASGDPEHVRQTDGGDFVFTDNLNSVILHHELERYDSTAERVERNNPERGSQDER